MMLLRRMFPWAARQFLGVFLGLLLYGTASAGIVGTEAAIESQHAAKAREDIVALAQRPELAEQLKAYGVAPDEAEARVNAMTDTEVLALAGKLGDHPAGGRLSNNELILILVVIILIIAL